MEYVPMTVSKNPFVVINTGYGLIDFEEWLMQEKIRLKKISVKSEIRKEKNGQVALFVEGIELKEDYRKKFKQKEV